MSGAATGTVRAVLRLEGASVLVAAMLAYANYGAGWSVFAACFLLPDLSLLGYLAGPRAGALAYNAAHSYVGPILCLAAAVALPSNASPAIGLIWCAHLGFDRALGYGLKYRQGFGYTHLGLIGRAARHPPSRAAPV